jgi:acetyl esterase/lipase
MDTPIGEGILLWPDGAPGALGDGPADRPQLRPALPAGRGLTAAVIVCAGGGYVMRAAHECEPVARWLCSLGAAGIIVDYRVKPYRHPAPLQDAQRAIRVVRARAREWYIDPARVGILGFSAGAHVAISAATIFDAGTRDAADPVERLSSRPDAFIVGYPVVTFGPFGHRGSMEALLGASPDPALVGEMSLETRVTEQTPPGFLWHTVEDPAVPVENSLLLAAAMSRCKVPFELHVFQSGQKRHGIGMAGDIPGADWTEPCAQWLAKIGFIRA